MKLPRVTRSAVMLLTCVGFFTTSLVRAADAPHPPNIVVILADDLGAHDLGCYGADLHETPHIDRLARDGVRFTQSYAAAPVCSPTRAALLTGKHLARLHITIWAEGSVQGPTNRKLLQAHSLHDLPHTETTFAKHLQSAGYLTALVGKRHLGDANHAPETHGFDVNIGGTHVTSTEVRQIDPDHIQRAAWHPHVANACTIAISDFIQLQSAPKKSSIDVLSPRHH